MAYNKRTWATGNVVGAVDLNRMEGGIEENHPGYEYREEIVTLWEGSVTMESEEDEHYADIPYAKPIIADKLRVTFDDTIYECDKTVGSHGESLYGGINGTTPDFSKYPFSIASLINKDGSLGFNNFATKTGGTHTLKLEASNTTVTTTECFQKAVKSVGDSGYECTTSFEKVLGEHGTTKAQENSPCVATLTSTNLINADEIKVVFNDIEYICPKTETSVYAVYGSYDFSFTDYPFAIGFSESRGNTIYTKDAIDFDIIVSAPVITATVTPCFETAVKTLIPKDLGTVGVSIPENSFLQVAPFGVNGPLASNTVPAGSVVEVEIPIPDAVAGSSHLVGVALNRVSVSADASQSQYYPIIVKGFKYDSSLGTKGTVIVALYNTSSESLTIAKNFVFVAGLAFYYDSNEYTTYYVKRGDR